jgi:hypothetical protein
LQWSPLRAGRLLWMPCVALSAIRIVEIIANQWC